MNDNRKLNWGILGAARINQRMLPAIVGAGNSRLLAIASRRPGAGAETLAKYAPQPHDIIAYDDPEELLKNTDIEAVYLPMANDEHAEWVLRAIEHGKHVLCEKPLALTLADIDAIETAAAARGVKVMEGFMYRFHPQHQRVKELLESGLIGEVRSVRTAFAFMMQPARFYRIEKDIAHGGGAMWDIGCYALHTARMHFDSPPVAATAHAKLADNGADLSCCGTLDFGDGKFAQFDFSFEHARRCEYQIIGTQGGLTCHTVWAMPDHEPVISWWTENGEEQREKLPAANHFVLEIEHFADCVLTGKTTRLSFTDAKENCRTIAAVLESVSSGRKTLV